MEFGAATLNTKTWLRSQCLFINDVCCQMSDGDMNDVTCVLQMILNGLNVIDCVETCNELEELNLKGPEDRYAILHSSFRCQ